MRKKWKIQKRWENKEGVIIQLGLEKDSSLPQVGRPKEASLAGALRACPTLWILLHILEV